MSRKSLHPDIDIIFSTATHGSMAGSDETNREEYHRNAERFLTQHEFSTRRTRLFVTYGEQQTYCEVARVTRENAGREIQADALYTTDAEEVITLPVADCIATVVYDPSTHLLGVLHLGRHSSVAGLIESFVIDVADAVGSDPRDWYVWMSPSLRQANDRLDYFDPAVTEEWKPYVTQRQDGVYVDTIGHNRARFIRAGVAADRIRIAPEDTYSDERYFSHRAYTQEGNPAKSGRMLLAVYRPKEPRKSNYGFTTV